jgi:hypothetical protein
MFYGDSSLNRPFNQYHPIFCPCAILIPKNDTATTTTSLTHDTSKHKLYDKATMGLFAGFSPHGTGFRVWIPETKTFQTSQHVKFDDNFSLSHHFNPITLKFTDEEQLTPLKYNNINTDELKTLASEWEKNETIQFIPSHKINNINTKTHTNKISHINNTLHQNTPLEETSDFFTTGEKLGIHIKTDPSLSDFGDDPDNDLCARTTNDETLKTPLSYNQLRDKEGQRLIYKVENNIQSQPSELNYTTPSNYKAAISDVHSSGWKEAMNLEKDLLENEAKALHYITKTEAIRLAQESGTPILPLLWTYRTKYHDGVFKKFRARLVQRGDLASNYFEEEETYSPVVRSQTIRALLSTALTKNMSIDQYDVPIAYLNAPPGKCQIVSGIPGYKKFNEQGEELYIQLKRNLYGGPDSGKQWNDYC